ncbi:hypothetical protein SFC43_34345 [Bacteroides sp. CR5/BHMF/2]|nr:hypothetical protein [Bacteroides sp. CR5/BHMF/2]
MKDGYYGGSNMFVRANGGIAIPPSDVKMTNAANDYAFRMRFTDYCTTKEQRAAYLNKMPAWIQDVRDMNFLESRDGQMIIIVCHLFIILVLPWEAVVAFQIIYSCWVIQVIMG